MRSPNVLVLILALTVALVGFAGAAHALTTIEVTEGERAPMPIAVPHFSGQVSDDDLAAQIADVVMADLNRSAVFNVLPRNAYIENPVAVSTVPDYVAWKAIGAQALVTGSVFREQGERLRVEFRLWDLVLEKQLAGQQFFTTPDNWRRVAHIVADAIYEQLTGEEGYFDSRIAFVAESGPKDARIKRLAIMDQDGANLTYLTDGANLVLTPRFSPAGQTIAYMSYEGGQPQVYLLDVETGQRQLLGDFSNMSFAPRFSPDGSRVLLSLQEGGNANIYEMDLATRQLTRLTATPAIDTAPSYAPDGSRIVFESDRGGSQQLYVMNADGSGVQRISYGDGRYSTPVWSPRGDLIAFTKQAGGRFSIGVMQPDGSGERVLTEGYHNEGPTWAPNGRVLAFFRETGGAEGGASIHTVDIAGRNEQRIDAATIASDPAWSPKRN